MLRWDQLQCSPDKKEGNFSMERPCPDPLCHPASLPSGIRTRREEGRASQTEKPWEIFVISSKNKKKDPLSLPLKEIQFLKNPKAFLLSKQGQLWKKLCICSRCSRVQHRRQITTVLKQPWYKRPHYHEMLLHFTQCSPLLYDHNNNKNPSLAAGLINKHRLTSIKKISRFFTIFFVTVSMVG